MSEYGNPSDIPLNGLTRSTNDEVFTDILTTNLGGANTATVSLLPYKDYGESYQLFTNEDGIYFRIPMFGW
jgi:hypothetical protein